MMASRFQVVLIPLVVAVLCLALAGCGGGGGGGPRVNPPAASLLPPPGQFDPAAYAAMTATEEELGDRYAQAIGQGTDGAATQALAWAQGQANVAETGRSPDGSVIWVRFKNGVITSLEYLTEPFNPAPAPRLPDVSKTPGGALAAIYNGSFDSYMNQATAAWAGALSRHGYNVSARNFVGQAFTPKSLADSAGGAGVVFIQTHGGGPPGDFPCLLTGQPCDATGDALYKQCLTEGSLIKRGYVLAGGGSSPLYYAVTDGFMKYLQPLRQARTLVFASACKSAEATGALASAFAARGSGVTYLGWDGRVNPNPGAGAMAALADLLSGERHVITDEMIAPVPAGNSQDDPFNLEDSLTILHALGKDGGAAGAQLAYVGDGQWGLMPHLDSLLAYHLGLTAKGYFGDTPGQFLWADLPPIGVPASNWSSTQVSVTAALVPQGARVGEVRIAAGGLRSNPLTYYATDIFSGHGSNGQYWVEIHIEDPNHQAMAVTAKGPGASGGVGLDYTERPQWFVNIPLPSPVPDPVYEITISGAAPAKFGAKVLGYSNAFPTPLSPVGTVTAVSRFTWGACSIPGAEYEVHLFGSSWEWASGHVQGTSVAYTGPALGSGGTYSWMLHSTDPRTGNLAAAWGSFTYQPK